MAKARPSAEELAEFLLRCQSRVFLIPPRAKETSALERLMALVVQGETGNFAIADKSVRVLREAFAHWNEVRVARRFEVMDVLTAARIGEAAGRALNLQEFLRRVFGMQNHLELDWMYDAPPERRAKLLAAVGMAPHHAATVLDLDALELAEPRPPVPLTPQLKRLMARMNFVGANPKEAMVREVIDPVTEGKLRYPNYLVLTALGRLMPVTKPPRCRKTEALLEAFKLRRSASNADFSALLGEVGWEFPLDGGAAPRKAARAKAKG